MFCLRGGLLAGFNSLICGLVDTWLWGQTGEDRDLANHFRELFAKGNMTREEDGDGDIYPKNLGVLSGLSEKFKYEETLRKWLEQ